MKRTHYCGQVRAEHIGADVDVCGWVHARRDHGGVIFIDMRDRDGLLQVVFSPDAKELFKQAEKLRGEYVIYVKGAVRKRPEGTENKNLPTGEVEVAAQQVDILNTSKVPPFEISDFIQANEDIRLKYRYLDLRRTKLKNNLLLRNSITSAIRKHLTEKRFVEVETPFLGKSTPEGARDFLVPARMHPGTFYALPQSPQLFKQILMVAGFDRYYQIVRCFRDEDLRSDRQLEFTQLDMEMSFIDEETLYTTLEAMLRDVFESVGYTIDIPFPRMPYAECMLKYGTDKPDLRYGMEIHDITETVRNCGFKVFSATVANGGVVRGVKCPGSSAMSRQYLTDTLPKYAGEFGAKGLAWIKFTEKGYESPITKFFKEEELDVFKKEFSLQKDDIVFFVADTADVAAVTLGALRVHLAEKFKLIDTSPGNFKFTWVVDFPLFEWSQEEKRHVSRHHPFTSPKEKDIELLDTAPEKVHARAYDLVLNGSELGGGSIRIHRPELQQKIFAALKISEQEMHDRFGFFLEALDYGAPPHGGIALGLDRFVALVSGEESIREVIAFPKTQKGMCPLTGAPDTVNAKQLRELQIRTVGAQEQKKQEQKKDEK